MEDIQSLKKEVNRLQEQILKQTKLNARMWQQGYNSGRRVTREAMRAVLDAWEES